MRKVSDLAKKILVNSLVICLAACLLTGCARIRRKIAYTIYPIGWLIQRIGGSYYDSVSIQEGNSLLQDAKIRADYKELLSSSKVLFHLGDCEPYMRVYYNDILNLDLQEQDVSVLNAVYDFARYTRTKRNGEMVWQETPYYEGSPFEYIDHDKRDLYIWLDPVSMLAIAGNIRNWMEQDAPEQADTFEENYSLLKQDLIELDAEYQKMADRLWNQNRRIAFASVSVSFGCWQKAYGIDVYPIMLSKYGVLPDQEQLSLIEERIRQDQVQLIVHETNLSAAEQNVYDRVKQDCGLQEISLSSLASLSTEEEQSGRDYLSFMYDNLHTLTEINQE